MARKKRIEQLVLKEFSPSFLAVEDESHQHHVPKNAETHYKVIMASSLFAELNRVARHRLVNKLLKEEFDSGMHALSLHLYSPEEWEKQDKSGFNSPNCRDGYKNK